MMRSIIQEIPDNATNFEMKVNNIKYIYGIHEDLVWINKKLVRIFYIDEEKFKPFQLHIFNEQGEVIFEDISWDKGIKVLSSP